MGFQPMGTPPAILQCFACDSDSELHSGLDEILLLRSTIRRGLFACVPGLVLGLMSGSRLWARTQPGPHHPDLKTLNVPAYRMVKASLRRAALRYDSKSQPTRRQKKLFWNHRIWLAGQVNVVTQTHGRFPAAYSGPLSFLPVPQTATSYVTTLFTGLRLTPHLEFLYDEEYAGGSGLSGSVGLAGFTNLDAVRAAGGINLGVNPYPARAMLHLIVPLSRRVIPNTPNYLELARHLPRRRIEIYFGKFTLPDFFDRNAYANSDHAQFMNWTIDNNGAWDYAANTRGYTYGAYAEMDEPGWTLRYAEVLMTKLPNLMQLSLHLGTYRAENAEADWDYAPSENGKLRFLAFYDHARMGSFTSAIAAWQAGLTPTPEVSAVRRPSGEYGLGLNWQQRAGRNLGFFMRAGWNNGRNESYSYTEVNNTVLAGAQISGRFWSRRRDHIGIAFVSNGISRAHAQYLADGGLGFQLGDGGLSYGREQIVEAYYNLHLWRGISLAPDLQNIHNPGYNRARGPVTVFGLRMHLRF